MLDLHAPVDLFEGLLVGVGHPALVRNRRGAEPDEHPAGILDALAVVGPHRPVVGIDVEGALAGVLGERLQGCLEIGEVLAEDPAAGPLVGAARLERRLATVVVVVVRRRPVGAPARLVVVVIVAAGGLPDAVVIVAERAGAFRSTVRTASVADGRRRLEVVRGGRAAGCKQEQHASEAG